MTLWKVSSAVGSVPDVSPELCAKVARRKAIAVSITRQSADLVPTES